LEGLTVSGAFSFLDSEITDVLVPTDDVREGDELAYAPEFQGNIRARYQWFLGGGMTAHVTPILSYSSEAFSDVITINRDRVESWTLVDLRAGVAQGNWTAELYAQNLFDEQAELQRNYVNDRERVIYARPRTFGLRVSFDF
jgi:outer membrane receptor protein involved in Fe transport